MMEKGIAPIPALYVCYLLRSIARHSSTYIGSTPHPPRRLRQHNGDAKGGAVRTSRDSLRPWEMTCLVTGFPSKIAALQFEWAWQNPNMTRHISPESRISQSRMTSRISPKTGKVRKRAKRPRLCLTDRLANLRLLLEAKSFRRWPLRLTFFAEDVFKMWQKLVKQNPKLLKLEIPITLNEPSEALIAAAKKVDASLPLSTIGINAIDVGYSSLKSQLEKSQACFADDKSVACAICKKSLPKDGAGTLVCTSGSCSATTHLQCLSAAFLEQEGTGTDHLVPKSGKCPSCGSQQQWIDLVKDLSLRMRGAKEIKAVFKPKRGKKAALLAPAEIPDSDDDEDGDPLDIVMEEEEAEDPLNMVIDEEEEDVWHELSDSSDDGAQAKKIRSDPSPVQSRNTSARLKTLATFSEPVIGDSEDSGGWSDAEVLT